MHPTYGEYLLFHIYLKKRPEHFRRQHIAEPFVLDFYLHSLKLIIELDGDSHYIKHKYDEMRDRFFFTTKLLYN